MRTEESVGISISEIWPLNYFAFRLDGRSVGTNLIDLKIVAMAPWFVDQASSKIVGMTVFTKSAGRLKSKSMYCGKKVIDT